MDFNNINPVDTFVAVWYGVQVSGSRNFYDGPWIPESLQVVELAANSHQTIDIEINEGVEGQRLFVRIVPFFNKPSPFEGQIIGNPFSTYDVLQTAEA